MSRHLLLKTMHGSHLYGLAHAGSDDDWFYVYANAPRKRARWAKQKVSDDGQDSLSMDLSTWLQACAKGTPQALEAMFSEYAEYDELGPFRAGYQAGPWVYETYLRTIENFVYTQDPKRKRHGLRLALNLRDIGRTGRFNPRLSQSQIDFVTEKAQLDTDVVYAYAMNIALDRLPPGMVG